MLSRPAFHRHFFGIGPTATGTGSLGSSAFANALITFVQTADTNNVVTSSTTVPFFSVQAITSTVTVAGVGTASFTSPTFTASEPGLGFGLGLGTAGLGGLNVIA